MLEMWNAIVLWPGSLFVFAGWGIICLLSGPLLGVFWERTRVLLNKPLIFSEDKAPETVQYYPRATLEQAARATRQYLPVPAIAASSALRQGLSSMMRLVTNPRKPMLPLGYGFFLLLLPAFVWADAIAVAQTLPSLMPSTLADSPWLSNYDIATAFGALVAIIVGLFILSEIHSETSRLTDWDEVGGLWRNLGSLICVLLVILGMGVVLLLAASRLVVMHVLPGGDATLNLVAAGLYALVGINVVLATALIFLEGLRGLFLIPILVVAILVLVLAILKGVLQFLGAILPVLFDWAMRLAFWGLDLLIFFIITPFQAIGGGLRSAFRVSSAPPRRSVE